MPVTYTESSVNPPLLVKGAIYRLADRLPYHFCPESISFDHRFLRFVNKDGHTVIPHVAWEGDKGFPGPGQFFISGAKPEGYLHQGADPLTTRYAIGKLVFVRLQTQMVAISS
jgi:hypothetical protein